MQFADANEKLVSKIKLLTCTFTVVLKGILNGSVYVKVTLCVSTKYSDDGDDVMMGYLNSWATGRRCVGPEFNFLQSREKIKS